MKSKSIAGLILLAIVGFAFAADLTYTNLVPQTSDDSLVLSNKQAVAMGKLAQGNSFVNITSNGTNSVSTNSIVLDRVVINKAGSADSTLTLSSGTNAVAIVSGASAPVSIPYNVRLSSGLSVVTEGTNAPNATVSYR